MSEVPPSDPERYRQQLEARARIFYATSDLWLMVRRAAEPTWTAELHSRNGGEVDGAVAAQQLSGAGESPEQALEEFANKLDLSERSRDA